MKNQLVLAIVVLSIGLAAGQVPTQTEMFGKHPHLPRANMLELHPYYLYALSDLRFARAHLDKLTPGDSINEQEQQAINEIDAAIKEIKIASIDDGKDLNDHPFMDVKLSKTDRYRKALELLIKASQDVNREEDGKDVQGLQYQALVHIRDAEKAVHEALVAAGK